MNFVTDESSYTEYELLGGGGASKLVEFYYTIYNQCFVNEYFCTNKIGGLVISTRPIIKSTSTAHIEENTC